MESSAFFKKFLLYVPVKLIPAFVGIFFILFLYSNFPEGEYVSYALGVACALITAQLSAAWVGTSYIYYFSSVKEPASFFYSCFWILVVIAFSASVLSGFISTWFVESGNFFYISVLCFSQILFFFLSAVFQSGFSVGFQLIAVFIQAVSQVLIVVFLFEYVRVDYKFALVSLAAGYLCSAVFLLFIKLKEYGLKGSLIDKKVLLNVLHMIYAYGFALSPWMLGMLAMAAVDRFVIGFYSMQDGDAYLSLKDLIIGGSGLLSMPLLMMVHSLVINKFRNGRFPKDIIQASFSFLIIVFTAFWVFLHFIGLDLFEMITKKPIGVTRSAIYVAFIAVFLSSVSVYAQKRLEVHRKISRLAVISILCAVLSVFIGFFAGKVGGVFEVSFAAAITQLLYLVILMKTMFRKKDLIFLLRPIFSAIFLFASGEFLSYTFISKHSFGEYWYEYFIWVMIFMLLVSLVLWRNVDWKSFTQ